MNSTKLKAIDGKHRAAMRLAEFADLCRTGRINTPEKTTVQELYRKAADIELKCARAIEGIFPSVLVLARSAASLYLNAGELGRGVEIAREYSTIFSPDGPIEINGELEYLVRNPSIAMF
ncbi:MAG TPA: hypothetical protein VJJ52_02190 [Candidatus Nanoarchaeia archaeon]|nr:hypothetical protein [Candidatus Nanoarchaeia archaeon]